MSVRILRAGRRLSGFTASVALLTLANILSIPVLITSTNPESWSAAALGQAVGTLVAILTGLGWPITGPSAVAQGSPEGRQELFAQSVSVRCATLVATVPGALALTFLLAPSEILAACILALSGVAAALGGSWFFVGAGSGYRLLAYDTAPRVLGIVAGTVSCAYTGDIVTYAFGHLAGALLAISMSSVAILGRSAWRAPFSYGLRSVLMGLRRQSHGLTISVLGSLAWNLPLLIVAAVAPAALPTFALADRMKQYFSIATSPAIQALQGWVPAGIGKERFDRARVSALLGLLLGLASAALFAVLSLPMASLLGAERVLFPINLSMAMAGLVGLNVAATVTGSASLVGLGHTTPVVTTTAAGLAVTVSAVTLLAGSAGAFGAAIGGLLGMAIILIGQLSVLGYLLRSGRALSSA